VGDFDPATGGGFSSGHPGCSVICEIAQLNSECMHSSLGKYVHEEVGVDMEILKKCFHYETSDGIIYDSEDWYRTEYFKRHKLKPWNLHWTAREGLVEDYFGAWCSDDENKDSYNPDTNWRIIFPFN
jgi:hypothetical protein